MVTTLQTKDLPEPWFHQKKPNSSTRQRRQSARSNIEGDSEENIGVKEPVKRGRGRPRLQARTVDNTKTKRRGRRVPPSTADVVMALSKTAMPDVNELSLKRDRDAIACGRTIRTVASPVQEKNLPTSVTVDKAGARRNDLNDQVAAVPSSQPAPSPLNCSELPLSPENDVFQDDVPVFFEGTSGQNEPMYCRPPSKEAMKNNGNDGLARSKKLRSTIQLRNSDPEMDVDEEFEVLQPECQDRHAERSPSPLKLHCTNHYKGREVQHYESPRHGLGLTSRRSHFQESFSANLQRHSQRRYGRADSRSPTEDIDKLKRFSKDEHMRHRTYESSSHSSIESNPCRRSCVSPRRGLELCKTSDLGDPSRSPTGRLTNRSEWRAREWPIFMEQKELLPSSPAMERRERRQNQAKREMIKTQRQRDGKKPFYLTLNDRGEPYGPGKPAWMSEINKLVAGLDPSCTHIRKQTFEDVQTFKDRLNENFDYSGTLNDDYLRGLMGKAVTKKRGELIAIIKSNGKQPLNIDEEVWKRLEKLANSKQREDKSEQGRYANACRQTMGRLGSIGINGVREKLRSRLNRSPDPDEILEEMYRDKGYGRGKRKVRPISTRKERTSGEFALSDEDIASDEASRFPDLYSVDMKDSEQLEQYSRNVVESSRGDRDYGLQEMDVVVGSNERRHKSSTMTGKKKMSTDEYIEKLKCKIQRLEDESGKASTSNIAMKWNSTMCNGYNSSD